MLPGRTAVIIAVVIVLTACGGDGPQPAVNADGDPLGPLEALAECEPIPTSDVETPEGLILPEGAVVQQVTPQKPLVNVTAYVPMTPVQFQTAYGELGVEILISENEIYEAELLISDGTYRNFLKAAATCRDGSAVLAVVAPELDAEGLPVPAGAGAAPSPSP